MTFKSEPFGTAVGRRDLIEDLDTWLRPIGDYRFTGTVLSVPPSTPEGARENVFLLERVLLKTSGPAELVPVKEFNNHELRTAFAGLLARHEPRLPSSDEEHHALYYAFVDQANRHAA